jgi:alpha-L-fucosidase
MPTDDMTPSLAQEIMAVIKKHPNVIINGRLGGGVRDDYGVSELMMERGGARGVWKGDIESCDSINTTWGYSAKDQEWKSTDFLIHYLVNSVSQGGNFLLNIGPDSTGAIPQPAIDRLKAVGKWMQVNSESIYGAGPTPFGGEYGSIDQTDPKKKWVAETAWRATTQPGKLYIHIFEWPSSNAFEISGQKLKVTHATLLADPQHHPLAITHNDQGYTIQLPAQAPDLDDSVLALDLQK